MRQSCDEQHQKLGDEKNSDVGSQTKTLNIIYYSSIT